MRPAIWCIAALVWGPALAHGAGPEVDPPFLEILQSSGAIDGPSEGAVGVPRWERVRLELRVVNRLAAEVRDLELHVALVSSAAGEAAVIPGWSFRETFSEAPVPAMEETYLRILRELPARRSSPPADEIAYRVEIRSYRLAIPELDTAIRLLGSSHEHDQLAALVSYEGEEARPAIARGLIRSIADLPDEPSATDALRMLLAVRALGTLREPSAIRVLLELPGSRDGPAWGRAVLDLATRMLAVSEPNAPRLRVLPSWARERSVLQARAPDALEDAVRDAILRMGDAAVPGLLHEAHLGSVPGVRARAQRLLHALGRSTVRSQLSVRDRASRLAVIEALGVIGSAEPVAALVELLETRDGEIREAAKQAIARIGPAAVDPLVAALGTPRDGALLAVFQELGPGSEPAIARAAQRYGLARLRGEATETLIARLRHHLFEARRAQLSAEVERALELGREGSFGEAFRQLDQVFARDPEVYMRYARPIAETYLERGRRLHGRGDYDAAVATLRIGQSIASLPEAESLLVLAQLALARGYLEVAHLDKVEETLAGLDAPAHPEVRALEAELLGARAEEALAAGDYGKARTFIARAQATRVSGPELEAADRKLLLAENLAIVLVLGLSIPALLLWVVVAFRRRFEAARMERLATDIDRDRAVGGTHPHHGG